MVLTRHNCDSESRFVFIEKGAYGKHSDGDTFPVFTFRLFFEDVHSTLLKVLKVASGAYSALQPSRLIVPLPPRSFLIHLQRRHAPHRHERPLLAKEGTIQEFG
jgi:hypothetical protein